MNNIQILISGDAGEPVISDVPEQLDLRPAQTIDHTDEIQEVQHDNANDDSPNRLSTILEEVSQASEHLAGASLGGEPQISSTLIKRRGTS